MDAIQKLTQRMIDFRNERNWEQFHNPKDLALSLVLEAAEVLEHFQWKNGEELERYAKEGKEEIAEEIMDVLYWVLVMCHDLEIDIPEAFEKKMLKNAKKYPIEKSSGNFKKYTEL